MNAFVYSVKDAFSDNMDLSEVGTLKEHEEIELEHLKILLNQMKLEVFLNRVITVDKSTNISLDGHYLAKNCCLELLSTLVWRY